MLCADAMRSAGKRVRSAASARGDTCDVITHNGGPLQSAIPAGEDLRGFQVDDAARAVIVNAGYGEYFTHRTGHSIGVEVHGNGANMDNFETHDERRVMPWSCFSVEPGIYLPNFGVRSEINMFIGEGEARVTGEIQRELVRL